MTSTKPNPGPDATPAPGPGSRPQYRGRLAPSPTGFLHLGHARTFWIAQERAREQGGKLILRNEDLDVQRCRAEFQTAMIEDLRWFGFNWQEGPDVGGPFAPYSQSERHAYYRQVLEQLKTTGMVFPCTCSRQDVLRAAAAPHPGEEEPIYPGTCRYKPLPISNARFSWRFRVPEGEVVRFVDSIQGPQEFVGGRDFGDFVIWRPDDVPAYQLAVVVDDALMQITEAVRGADLLTSTARQLLIYRALGWEPPTFCHCPLLTDENGVRLAKRHDARSLRALRAGGHTPQLLRDPW